MRCGVTNNLNTTTETTRDYFAISEEMKKNIPTQTKVDIETKLLTKVLNNVIEAKSITIGETENLIL